MVTTIRNLYLILLLVGLLSSGVLSCTRYRQSDTEDRLEKIQRQIDNDQYEESIHQLQEILKSEPNNDRARAILASVYVRRAGVVVKNYFDLAKIATMTDTESSEPVIDTQSLKKIEEQGGAPVKNLAVFLRKVNETAAQADKIVKKFEAIPVVSNQSARDLQSALLNLEEMKDPTPGMLLYRGIIKLYYFKFLWVNHALLPVGDGRLCSLSAIEIARKLKIMNEYSFKMMIDIAAGFPKEMESIAKQARQFQAVMSSAQIYLLKLPNSELSLKQIFKLQLKDLNVRNITCDF